MSNLPNDVIFDILLRLPIKSLLRFKSVSKPWLSLISNPNFATLHYNETSKNCPKKILISTPSLLQSLDSSTSSFANQNALTPLDCPFKKPYSNIVNVIGSCNGLVCVALDNYMDIFIWNPATGAYRKLPNLNISCHETRYQYGFGYDSSTNDYKVFFSTRSIYHSPSDTQVNVFALKNESWKRVPFNSTTGIRCCETLYWQRGSTGSLVNGRLHWLAKWRCGHGNFTVITAFDLTEEKFSEVPMPGDVVDAFNGNVFIFLTLGVVDGCLCLVTEGRVGGTVELWMMKEYGVKFSGEKLYDVGNCNKLRCDNEGMVPLCFTSRGKIIMTKNGNELVRYNPANETKLEHLMVTSEEQFMASFESMEAIAYDESLMSPHVCINM